LFDPKDDTHLRQIDLRLNQNYFVGAAVSHLKTSGQFADGETLWLAESAPPLVPMVAQAGFLAAGSLHPRVMARLVGRRSACARYAVLEASRLPLLLGDVLPTSENRARPAPPAVPEPAAVLLTTSSNGAPRPDEAPRRRRRRRRGGGGAAGTHRGTEP